VIGEVRSDDGALILPVRRLRYDTLVIAVGSMCNDFDTPGVAEHAWKLDAPWQAHLFHRKLVNACFGANHRLPQSDEHLSIAIVGAGATGVELAAELRDATRALAGYGLRNLDADRHIRIALIEAGPRILPNLTKKLSDSVAAALAAQHIEVRTAVQVTRVTPNAIQCAGAAEFAADLIVWAAGIRAPAVLRAIDGLETDRIDRLLVGDDLRTTRDSNIFALGDCAAAPWPDARSTLPPRAQVAHQQAQYLARILPANARGDAVKPFRYRDHGSLISLGHAGAVGSLMGFVRGKDFRIQGLVASFMYWSLYRSHRMALHGVWKTALDTVTGWLRRPTYPRVKLH
jgi:NADH dehydrogenase